MLGALIVQQRRERLRQTLGHRVVLQQLGHDVRARDQIRERHVLHAQHTLHDLPRERRHAISNDERGALKSRLERRSPRLHQPSARVAQQRPSIVHHRASDISVKGPRQRRGPGDHRLHVGPGAAHQVHCLQEKAEVSLDFLFSGTRQNREDRASRVQPPGLVECCGIDHIVRPIEQRIPHVVYRRARGLENLHLEGKDHGNTVGHRRQSLCSPRARRPHLRRDVVEHRATRIVRNASDAHVEARVVDGNHEIRRPNQ